MIELRIGLTPADPAARMAAGYVLVDRVLEAKVAETADRYRERLASASPIDRGYMAGAWTVVEGADHLQKVIVNPQVSEDGRNFPYPEAQLTGTGARGAASPRMVGYSGGYKTAVPGMAPAVEVRATWDTLVSTSILATGSLLANAVWP